MKKDLQDTLIEQLELLEKSVSVLQKSYNKCKKIGIKKKYNDNALVQFEALTARFARSSDILTQQIFRLIDEFEREDPGSVRDRINKAEKREIISSAEKFIDVRDTRNRIVHTYSHAGLISIFKEVLKLTPYLISSAANTKTYCQKYFKK